MKIPECGRLSVSGLSVAMVWLSQFLDFLCANNLLKMKALLSKLGFEKEKALR
jgi:hypothetical protein